VHIIFLVLPKTEPILIDSYYFHIRFTPILLNLERLLSSCQRRLHQETRNQWVNKVSRIRAPQEVEEVDSEEVEAVASVEEEEHHEVVVLVAEVVALAEAVEVASVEEEHQEVVVSEEEEVDEDKICLYFNTI